MSKYRAKKTTVDGITFDSKAESRRYTDLRLLEKAGIISDLELQPLFRLQDGFTDGKGTRHRSIDYVADFRYIEDGRTVVEDVKGMRTPVYKLKKKLLLKQHPHMDFRES